MTYLLESTFENITIKETSRKNYDAFTAEYDIYPFLESSWIESFKCDYIKPIYFEFLRINNRVGFAGGIIVKSKYRFLNSISKTLYVFGLPYTCGATNIEIMRALNSHLMQTGFITITIARYFNQEEHFLTHCGFDIKKREECIIDLQQSPTQLWRNLSKGQKWTINKSKKAGLMFTQSYERGALATLMSCLMSTKDRRAQKGVGNYNYFYVPFMNEEVLLKQMSSKIASVCWVQHQDEIVSACLLINNNSYCYYLLAGSTPHGYELGASSFMLWNTIEMMNACGCKQLNLGALPEDESAEKLAQFKHSFGSKSVECEGGSAYITSSFKKQLHRAYKILSQPNIYSKRLLTFLSNLARKNDGPK